jgi:hypothetical protein
MCMAPLPSWPMIRLVANGHRDANRPEQLYEPIGQPGVPNSGLADGEELPAAVDPLQGMLSPIFHRDVGTDDEVPNGS